MRNALPSGVRSTLVNVNLLPLTPQFWTAALHVLFAGRQPDRITDPIIALDYGKYAVNRAPVLKPFDALIEQVWRLVASIYVVLFKKRLRRQSANLLVVWGGFQLPVAAALAAAREAGIRTLYCENGYLPKTIVMDPAGINAGNSLMGKDASFYRAMEISEDQRRQLFDMSLVVRPFKKGSAASENIVLPEQYVFLPLQVHDDSQILLYSPDFPDMPSVVRFCAAGVAAYNTNTQAPLKLVVKEHPSDHGRVDYTALASEFPDVIFTKTLNTQQLIEKSSAVITVNSTVGIEAMLRLKPVITLGQAFYAVSGLVTPCRATDSLSDILTRVLETPVDRDLTERFLGFLKYRYLVPLDRNDLAASDANPAAARILETLG